MDSGASVHVFNDASWFTSLNRGERETIFAGTERLESNGIGTVRIVTSNGCELELQDALHVPEFLINVVSLYRLGSKGIRWDNLTGQVTNAKSHEVLFQTEYRNNQPIIVYRETGPSIDSIFAVSGDSRKPKPVMATSEDI